MRVISQKAEGQLGGSATTLPAAIRQSGGSANGKQKKKAEANVQNPDKRNRAGLREPAEDWTDEELICYCQEAEDDGKQAEEEAVGILRRSFRLRWRACIAASILRARHKKGRTWGKVVKQHGIPRSTASEMADIYDRATSMGHGEEDVVKHRTWTDVKVAYGVVKNRDARTAKQSDKAVAEQAVAGNSKPGSAQPAKRAKKKKPHEDSSSPTEVGYAERFVAVLGGWQKTNEVVDAVTTLVAGVSPNTWERAVQVVEEAQKLAGGK